MKYESHFFWLMVVAVCALAQGNALAQTGALMLTTKTGDKLSGKFVRVTSERLDIETSYAGVISIRTADLADWQTADGTLRKQIAETLPAAHTVKAANETPAVSAKIEPKKTPTVIGKANKAEAWQRSLNFAYALSRGNVNTSDLNASLALSRKRGTRRVAFNSLGRYSVRNGTQIAHLLTSSLRYERTLAHLPIFTETLFEVDRIKKLDYRLNENIGLSYPMIKRDSQQLTFDFGTGLTREVYDNEALIANAKLPPGMQVNAESLKATSLFRAKAEQKINGKAQLSQQVSIFSNLMEPENYRMQTDISFTMPITRYLGFKLAGLNRFDNQPISTNLKRNDFSLLTGFNINF